MYYFFLFDFEKANTVADTAVTARTVAIPLSPVGAELSISGAVVEEVTAVTLVVAVVVSVFLNSEVADVSAFSGCLTSTKLEVPSLPSPDTVNTILMLFLMLVFII